MNEKHETFPVFYSVIIPAYNEQEWLPETIAALKKAMAGIDLPGEVIVVDNNSSDKTAEIASRLGAEVVFESVNQISRARNTGARASRGRFLIFLDADTLISTAILQKAIENLSGEKCCAGGAKLNFIGKDNVLAKKLVQLWNLISEKWGIAAGCFIYCRREAFDDVGGFSQKVFAGEELLFSRSLKTWGKEHNMDFRIISNPLLLTSGRKLEWFSLLQMLGMLLVMIVFPFSLRFRSLCSYWYKRP